ncbi:hypothetical protein HYPSUDRAFT_411256 [Hypholoma sublateritium FD-334 SS-4]|uniref:Uncharacterized protein n=1 Tax=Hypholoma sublateritium (strain FD-334 SS-4) TaxID=945553 RepID=A0A0D2P379_HYPSF|nr:hypothetical protein HYPSUDRAFT_411256 [Hypholoma sublateritium FD-334 SS-4]
MRDVRQTLQGKPDRCPSGQRYASRAPATPTKARAPRFVDAPAPTRLSPRRRRLLGGTFPRPACSKLTCSSADRQERRLASVRREYSQLTTHCVYSVPRHPYPSTAALRPLQPVVPRPAPTSRRRSKRVAHIQGRTSTPVPFRSQWALSTHRRSRATRAHSRPSTSRRAPLGKPRADNVARPGAFHPECFRKGN